MKVFLVEASNVNPCEYDAVVYTAISEERALKMAECDWVFSSHQFPLIIKEIALDEEQRVLVSFHQG